MDELRKVVAALTLSAIMLALAAPALAQMQSMPMASPATMPVERSDKDMMAALAGTKDTGMAASIMKTSGLEGMMKPGETYTLFVASDQALKATSPDVLKMMKEKVKDRQIGMNFVKGHMVGGTVTPDEMTDGKTLTLMNGKTMTVRRTDGGMMVDDANIVKAVKTSNGMVYVMDRIPSFVMAMAEQMGMLPMSPMPAAGE